uniref:NADH dehydrogenase subunit 6 n=1 Tax=Romanomermis culicivorax TaxID=13658 RepID=A0A915JUR6_ROMCU
MGTFLLLSLVMCLCLLIVGSVICSIDIDRYSFALYIILVAIVGLIVGVAFCVIGSE